MIKIYHNPRCQKSREGLAIVQASGKPFTIIRYLDDPLSENELEDVLEMLKIPPMELVRTGEKVWKENYKHKELTNKQIIETMVTNPKLIERPIVIVEKKAVIGRPKERIETLLSQH